MIRANLSPRKLTIWGPNGEEPYQCVLPSWHGDCHNWLIYCADYSMGITERSTLVEMFSAIHHFSGQPVPAWATQLIREAQ